MLIHSLLIGNIITNTAEYLAQSTTGTPTGEHLPSSPGHPLETLHNHYLLPIRDFHWM